MTDTSNAWVTQRLAGQVMTPEEYAATQAAELAARRAEAALSNVSSQISEVDTQIIALTALQEKAEETSNKIEDILEDISAKIETVDDAVLSTANDRAAAVVARDAASTSAANAKASADRVAVDPALFSTLRPIFDIVPIDGVKPQGTTFTRASTALRVNRRGLLETVNADTIRVDYSAGRPGWRLEGTRKNISTFSIDFDQWETQNLAITRGVATPRGPMARLSIAGNGDGYLRKSMARPTGDTFTYSVEVRADVSSRARVDCWFGDGASQNTVHAVDFNLATGVGTTVEGSPIGRVENLGDGYWRLSVTGKAASSGQTNVIGDVRPYPMAPGAAILARFAQMEAGNGPTSYIPTTSEPVTRAIERFVRPIGSDWNFSEGSLVFRGRMPAVNTEFDKLWIADNGTHQSRLELFRYGPDNAVNFLGETSAGGKSLSFGQIADGADFTLALGWKDNDAATAANGVLTGTRSDFIVPRNLTMERLACDFDDSSWNGLIYSVSRFDKRLSNADLIALSGAPLGPAFDVQTQRLIDSGAFSILR